MASEVHAGDLGTVFEPTVRDEQENVVGLAAATVLRLRFRKPDGTIMTRTPVLSTDGSDGKMRYVTTATDLDQAGIWRIEGYVEMPSGAWTTNQHRVRVLYNLSLAASAFDVSASEGLAVGESVTPGLV